MHACRRGKGLASGFTLAEVLVALFVVAVGVAGAAGVQAHALRAGREAAHLTDGVRLAAALAERIQANPAAMALPDTANPYLQLDTGADAGLPAASGACYAQAGCGAAQLAQLDIAETARDVAAALPGARLLACRDGADVVAWECDGAAEAPLVIKLGWRSKGAPALPQVLLPVAPPPLQETPP